MQREKKVVISKQENFSTTMSRSYIVFTLPRLQEGKAYFARHFATTWPALGFLQIAFGLSIYRSFI